MISLLKQRNFSLLWFGGLISFTGDWVLFTALPLYVYTLTGGSVLATGFVFVINSIPGILFGSLAGVYTDRWDRKQTLVITNLLRSLLLLALLFVTTSDHIWIVYVIGFLGRSIGQFMIPAEHALLPKLVGDKHLVKANALNSLNNNLARLIGPALGGTVVLVWSFAGTVLIDAASFLLAALLIALIAAPSSVTRADPEKVEDGTAPHPPSILREWKDGLKIVAANRDISFLFILLGFNAIAEGLISVLVAIYVTQSLGGGELEFGWLLTAQAVGGLLGGLFIGKVSDLYTPRQMVGVGFILLGIIDAIIWNTTNLIVALTFMVIVGLPIVALSAGAMTIFQRGVADRYRGRVMGAFGSIQSVLLLGSQLFASFFGGVLGAVPLLTFSALFNLFAGIAAFFMLSKRVGLTDESLIPTRPIDLAVNTTSD